MRKKPKIVLFDLETLPDFDAVMKVYPSLSNFPGLTLKAQINSIACAGYSLFEDKKVHVIHAWDFKNWKRNVNDDYELVKFLRNFIADADAVVTHNGKKFDWKFLQTRIIKHGLNPLPKIPHIDTCELSKRYLYLVNNKLDTLGAELAEQRKLDNGGWELWERVRRRELKSLKLMSDYCKQDVVLLKAILKRLLPFISNMPNQNLWSPESGPSCPTCGSKRLKSDGIRATSTRVYRRLCCKECGSWAKIDIKGKLSGTT